MDIGTVIYESENPVSPGKKFCAFLVQQAHEVVDRKRTGRMVPDQLPVVFWGTSAQEVDQAARKFWADETAKAKAKAEHGKALGQSRRKVPA